MSIEVRNHLTEDRAKLVDLNYDSILDTEDRSTLVNIDSNFMATSKKPRQKTPRRKQIVVTAGKFPLKVPGYSGIQTLSASAIIPFIPKAKLKQAAKKVLKKLGVPKIKKRRKAKIAKKTTKLD